MSETDEPLHEVGASGSLGWRDVGRPIAATLALLSVVVVVRWLLGVGATRTPGSAAFSALVEFEVWALLLSLSVGLWVAIAVFLSRAVLEVHGRLDPAVIALCAAGYLLLIGALVLRLMLGGGTGGPPVPLFASSAKIRGIVVTILLLGLPAVLGLWCNVARVAGIGRLLRMVPSGGDRRPVEQRGLWVAEMLRLRGLSLRILAAVSTGISVAVLSTGALRHALLRGEVIEPSQFPSEWVLFYGAVFTVLFVLVFVPSFLEWRGVAIRLVDDAFPVPRDGVPSADWHDGRDATERMLGLDVSPLRALGPLAGILAPVVTSLVAVLVPQVAS